MGGGGPRATGDEVVHFDHWIARRLAAHPTGAIVEIGAELNTRYERLGPAGPRHRVRTA